MKKKSIFLLLVIYITFIALGLPDALLGSAWNLVRVDLNTSLGTLGIMTVLVYLMSIFATYNAPRLLRIFQTKYITLTSVIFTGVALILISQVNHFYQILFFAIPLGLGAGAIDVSLNHYLAAHYEAKHMNYLHSFYGIGVTAGPSIMAYTLSQNSWRMGYIIVGSLLLFIAFLLFLSLKLWAKETDEHRQLHHPNIKTKDILKTKGAIYSIAIFVIYVHVESLAGVWIASYFYIVKEVDYATAALFATSFYLALTIGRLTSGFLSTKITARKLIIIGSSLMILSSIFLWFKFEVIAIYFIIVFILGLGAAPIYPNMMFLNGRVFSREKLSKIMSLQMGIGYLGFGLLTPAAGALFQLTTIKIYPLIMMMMTVFLGFLIYQYIMKTKDVSIIKKDLI
jgi:fucose permease